MAALVDCEAYLKRTREYIKKEKFWMTERMRKLGLNVWGSEANYIFFKGKAGLYKKALKSGLLIRDCSNYEGLTEGHYRIAIRSEEEDERLIHGWKNYDTGDNGPTQERVFCVRDFAEYSNRTDTGWLRSNPRIWH